jgi:hypothetical protein
MQVSKRGLHAAADQYLAENHTTTAEQEVGVNKQDGDMTINPPFL